MPRERARRRAQASALTVAAALLAAFLGVVPIDCSARAAAALLPLSACRVGLEVAWSRGHPRRAKSFLRQARRQRRQLGACHSTLTVRAHGGAEGLEGQDTTLESDGLGEVGGVPRGAVAPAAGSGQAAAEGVADGCRGSTVRIVAISDTHGFHRNLDIPDGDVLIHCGDAAGGHRVGRGGPRIAAGFPDFAKWFLEQPHERKYFVAGNHDNSRQALDLLGPNMIRGNLDCLGLTVHGLPHSRSERGYTEIPRNVDVLVSHVPPKGVLDKAAKPGRRVLHAGSKGLQKTLAKLGSDAPRLHLFGHIHEARGVKISSRGTLYANVANANPGIAECLHHGCMVFDVAVPGTGNGTDCIRIVKKTSEGLRGAGAPTMFYMKAATPRRG